MKTEKKFLETDFEKMSDTGVLSMVVDGVVSRNKCYEFFKTKRGQELFKKAKMIMGFLQDLKNGAEITGENNEAGSVLVTLENVTEKYKRTVFMDKNMYSVFSLRK
jgi:hypothetical protein